VDVKEGTFLSAPNDSLTLVVKDYGITSVHPLPSALGDAGPTWRGPIGLIDPSLSVDLNIWHASPLVLLRLRPYDLLNWPWSVFVDFLYVLMNSLALFWYLWLVRRHPEAPWPAGKAGSRLNLLMQWVIGVCFVPLVLDLAQALTPGLDSEAVLSAIGLVLAIALWAVFRKRDQNTVGYLALVLLRAAMIALAAAAIIFGVVYAWWQLPFFIDYRVVAWVLDGAILTVVLYASVEVVLEVFAAESRITQNALWRFLLRATLILAVLAVSIPVATSDYRATGIGNTDSLLQTISASFQLLQYYAAYVVLIGLAAVLRRTVGSTDPRIRRLVVGVAFLLFVNFVVSIDPYFFLPLSFVLGLITFWLLLVVRTDERNGLLDDAQEIRDKRADLLDQLEKTSVARQLRSAVEALTKKVADGTMTMETFESRSAKVDAYLKAHEEGTSVQTASGKGRLGRRVVLAYGPGNDEWSNGLHGALIGLIIAVPWLIFYIGFFLFRAGQISSPVKPLVITDVVIFEPFSWALLGFFFGYFFTYFRGNTGLQKGLWVALVFSICMAPYWLTSPRSVPDALATALVVCTYILVFTGTGLWFDVESLRAGLGARFDWNSFGRLTGLGSITAFGSVVLATVGLALTSVLTGAVVSIAGLLLHAVGAPVPATPTH
jgi:hypothetical protein